MATTVLGKLFGSDSSDELKNAQRLERERKETNAKADKQAVENTQRFTKMMEDSQKAQKPMLKKQEPIPSDIADQLQTSRNQKAAADYEKRRAAGDDYKKGGAIKSKCACGGGKMAKGGKVSSASKRADGIAIRGKTRA